jgi:hypothetical protein
MHLKEINKDQLECIFRNNNISYIKIGQKDYFEYVENLQDIVDAGEIDIGKNFLLMSNIFEYPNYFQFRITYFNKKHGPYAMYVLDSIKTYGKDVKLYKRD